MYYNTLLLLSCSAFALALAFPDSSGYNYNPPTITVDLSSRTPSTIPPPPPPPEPLPLLINNFEHQEVISEQPPPPQRAVKRLKIKYDQLKLKKPTEAPVVVHCKHDAPVYENSLLVNEHIRPRDRRVPYTEVVVSSELFEPDEQTIEELNRVLSETLAEDQ